MGRGRDPLPAGVDLTDGPFLREQGKGKPNTLYADVGQGAELARRFLEAMEVDEVDVENGDDRRVRDYFAGEALERQLRRIERARQATKPFQTRIVTEHRVMRTILGGQGEDGKAYLIVDAATERTQQIKPWLPGSGQPIEVVRELDVVRDCYSWLFVLDNGVWKLTKRLAGDPGGYCPPGWV